MQTTTSCKQTVANKLYGYISWEKVINMWITIFFLFFLFFLFFFLIAQLSCKLYSTTCSFKSLFLGSFRQSSGIMDHRWTTVHQVEWWCRTPLWVCCCLLSFLALNICKIGFMSLEITTVKFRTLIKCFAFCSAEHTVP